MLGRLARRFVHYTKYLIMHNILYFQGDKGDEGRGEKGERGSIGLPGYSMV